MRKSRWHRFLIARVLAATLAIAILAAVLLRSTDPPKFPEDGFVNFEPTIDMFPGPPVPDAEATLRFGAPEYWQWAPTYCTSPTLDYRDVGRSIDYPVTGFDYPVTGFDYPVTGFDFTGVRYDWSEAGTAKAWIVNEQTIGFTNDYSRDQYLDELRDALDRCGWEYDGPYENDGFNAIPLELPRLPEGSVAYKSERNPGKTLREPVEATFQAITVLIPGDQPNHLMVVSWIGWGTEVPAESAEIAADSLVKAANDAARQGSEVDG